MIQSTSLQITSESGLPILLDYTYDDAQTSHQVALFCHGYKGFKDWGAWHLIAEEFAKNGIAFVKFNFSHYGGTPEQPTEFNNLEAFAEDNYTTQVQDVNTVINWAAQYFSQHPFINLNQLTLIGHSRGGGIAVLVAAQNHLVDQLITWAAVADFESRFPTGSAFEQWKTTGVYHVKNGRTGQLMPHYFQFFEDFKAHEQELHILNKAKTIKQPCLIIHGNQDEAVSLQNAKDLHQHLKHSVLKVIPGANHVFGMKHPWDELHLPEKTSILVQSSINFMFESQLK